LGKSTLVESEFSLNIQFFLYRSVWMSIRQSASQLQLATGKCNGSELQRSRRRSTG